MSKLIDVDKIDWQPGVFVNPNTNEPLPIIHKIATIEMLRDWQEEEEVIPIDRVKQAIEEIENRATYDGIYIDRADVLEILDKLIAESEE